MNSSSFCCAIYGTNVQIYDSLPHPLWPKSNHFRVFEDIGAYLNWKFWWSFFLLQYTKIQRNGLHQHLQANVEAHFELSLCEVTNTWEWTIIRKDELEGLVTIKTNLRELDAAMNGVLQRIGNTEESIKTVKFQLWSKINKQLSPFEARLTVIEREGELRDEMIENYRRIQQNLQGEIETIRRKIQELPITRPESTGKRLQAGALGMSAFQLPTLVGPSAPPLPRPTGLPRSQRRISGVAQLADMTDGKRCAFSADETRTLSREVSNNVHVGNKFVWKFTQVDDCLQKAKEGSNTHHYI